MTKAAKSLKVVRKHAQSTTSVKHTVELGQNVVKNHIASRRSVLKKVMIMASSDSLCSDVRELKL